MAFIFEIDKDGHARPKLRCDSCGGVIKNYADGYVTLDTESATPGAVVEPIFRCTPCEEKAEETGAPQRSMRIDHFMLYVLNNIQLTPNVLESAERSLKETTAP
jgi:hypothetical protein